MDVKLLPATTLLHANHARGMRAQPVLLALRRVILIACGIVATLSVAGTVHAQAESRGDTSNRILAAPKDDLRVEALMELGSKGDDASCWISPTDGSIYFTSSRDDGKNVIYVAKRVPEQGTGHGSHWSSPEKFLELPGKENVSSLSVAADGITALLGVCNRHDAVMGSCDIYQGEMGASTVDHLVPLGPQVNTEWWDAQPTISTDGQTMYFASDRKGGHGGSDIYMCERTSDGKWGTPVNASFNTSGDEMAPFIAADNQTLYFAANHLPGGMGGFDIYMTHRNAENSWTEPKNLGPTINSPRDEMFFYVPPAGNELYFSSDREGPFRLFHVYVQPPPPKPKFAVLTGRLIDGETHQPLSTTSEITISVGGEKMSNDATGSAFKVRVPAGSLVHVDAGADAYVSNTLDWKAPDPADRAYSSGDPELTKDIVLMPSHARIMGHVSNAFTQKPLKAKVTLEQLAGGAPPVTVESDPANGAFMFNVNPLITYKISATAVDYEPYPTGLDPVKVEIPAAREKMITVEKEIHMTPVGIQPVIVYFEFAKFDLKPEEKPKFDHFIQQVKENSYVRIEVNGYADTVGSVEKNMKLSEDRANGVVNYLLSQGVPHDQVAIVKGFGKSQADPNDQAKNRRVEVRIVGKQD
ncbi:MAG: OmpA family protein [Bacteroidota bacterium]|nr:OmpA family protein [Bacteroidota bacterium]MDP4234095.1 OmpA family protein [Bacteroidota bacterium]MDP4243036.1 OmpA family protein [Bacteroidota bacterium]MDP4287462.1 OmpA family protein [Bacteroidota bacterium]